jgi:putative transposase
VIGVTLSGHKEVLGMWVAQTEGAKFWLQILTELKNRGVQDILIACVDGLRGFPEAIEAVYPKTEVQLCIVHLVRHSLNYVSWKQRKEVAADLKKIYQAATRSEAEMRLTEFEGKWDTQYPMISQSWRRNWEYITPFFAHPPEIRRVIYTTNAIEATNRSLRKVTKTRGSFPTDEAALKLLYLAIQNITRKWTRPIKDWRAALGSLSRSSMREGYHCDSNDRLHDSIDTPCGASFYSLFLASLHDFLAARRLTLMRPPIVKRQNTPMSGILAAFLCWRSRCPEAQADFISTGRCRRHVSAPNTY